MSHASAMLGIQPTPVDPNVLLRGTVLIAAPHSDDELLGCGAAISRLRDTSGVHVVYFTDGSGSPSPAFGRNPAVKDLPRLRAEEARRALAVLGVPAQNMTFLGYPDGRLHHHLREANHAFHELCQRLRPRALFAPFRYDSHPDHLAVNRLARQLIQGRSVEAELLEYFVYFRLRMLPKCDLRAYIRPKYLFAVEPGPETARRRKALSMYATQCTTLFSWQARPILEAPLLDALVQMPEIYFQADAPVRDVDIFTIPPVLIRAVQGAEPRLKKLKDQVMTALYSKTKARLTDGT